MNKIITVVVLLFFVGASVWVYLRSKPDKLYATPSNQTYTLIAYILDDFDAIGVDAVAMQNLVSSLKEQTNSYSINHRLVEFLTARPSNLRPLQNLNTTNGVFCDAWGTPFLFALTNTLTASNLVCLATNSHPRPFVIWSAGPNRSNELGSGDDLSIMGR